MNSNTPRRELKIGLAWQTMTSENLGVGALAQSNMAIARAAAERSNVHLSFVEFCPTGPNRKVSEDMGVTIADPLSPKGIITGKSAYYRQLKECDLVLDIGAGDSFSDIYGGKHFFFLCFSKTLAYLSGRPLVFSPQTIGPFKSRVAVHAAKAMLKRAKRVFARDGLSKGYLDSLGVSQNTAEVIDVAFRLPFTPHKFSGEGVTRVGINVSGLLYNGGYTRNNQFGLASDYAGLVDRLIAHFSKLSGVEVHLVSHVLADTMPVEDDYATAKLIANKYPGVIVAPKFSTPSEAKSYISGLDFFTGARMHACIGAFSSGVPVVPMAYSRKFNGLFSSLGYNEIADLKSDGDEVAFAKIAEGFNRRKELKVAVDAGNARAREKIAGYEDYLATLIDEVAGRKYANGGAVQ